MEEDPSKGYWKNVLSIIEDAHTKKPPQNLDKIRSFRLHPTLVKRQRREVLGEYMKLKAIDSQKVDPPPYLEGLSLKRERTLVDDPWSCQDQAVRQLANVKRKSPRQRFFPGSGDPKLLNTKNRFGVSLRPIPRQLTRLRSELSDTGTKSASWRRKNVLPDIGQEYREFENTEKSPKPITTLDRGIAILYDVDEKSARIRDVDSKDIENEDTTMDREETFVTNGAQVDILFVSQEETGERAGEGAGEDVECAAGGEQTVYHESGE